MRSGTVSAVNVVEVVPFGALSRPFMAVTCRQQWRCLRACYAVSVLPPGTTSFGIDLCARYEMSGTATA
eukprot:2143720-Rhodomonas_salina.4